MDGKNKIILAILIIIAIIVISRYIPVINITTLIIYLLPILVSIGILFQGMEDVSRSGIAAKELKDGYYTLMSIPTIKTLFGGDITESGFTPMNEFKSKEKELGGKIEIHLLARYGQETRFRYFVIPAQKIKEKHWPLLQIYHQIEIKDGVVKNIYKPGEYES